MVNVPYMRDIAGGIVSKFSYKVFAHTYIVLFCFSKEKAQRHRAYTEDLYYEF